MRILAILILLFLSFPGYGSYPYRYNLATGEEFTLNIQIIQNSSSESQFHGRSVSLDVATKIAFRVAKQDSLGNYFLECRYVDPSLTLFSTSLDLSLDSESGNRPLLSNLTDSLEAMVFTLKMNVYGEPLAIDSLDRHIEAAAEHLQGGREEKKVVTRTVKDAFGRGAFLNLCHMMLNLYPVEPGRSVTKQVPQWFSQRILTKENNFYYTATHSGQWRVQGVGVIDEEEVQEPVDKKRVLTSIRGKQTYDYLCDPVTGVLVEGVSRQRLSVRTLYQDEERFPEGLEVPSETVTEYLISR